MLCTWAAEVMGFPVAQNAYLFAFSIHFCPSFNHLSHIFSDLCLLSSWSSIIYRSVVGGTSRPAGETVYPHITHHTQAAWPKGDGAAAQAHVVRRGGPRHRARLGPALTPPAAPGGSIIFTRYFEFFFGILQIWLWVLSDRELLSGRFHLKLSTPVLETLHTQTLGR